MSDIELLNALSVIARRMGLIGQTDRLIIETAAVAEVPRCLAFGTAGQVRLCCTRALGHKSLHSWETAMVGLSACTVTAGSNAGAWTCERPAMHEGEHEARGATGVRWSWGDAPRGEETGELDTACGAQEWGTNGHRMSCVLRKGHEGAHRGVDADGTSMVTWPCPCYPDCTGHVVTPKSCGDVAPDGSAVCIRDAGHEPPHQSATRNMSYDMWPVPPFITEAERAAAARCHAVDSCIHEAGHRGDHETRRDSASDLTEPRAS